MKVCWFSTGVSSFMACYLASDIDKILYTHVSNQHPDSLRFLHDCESVLNREITILQSKRFASVDDVIMKRRAKQEREIGHSCIKGVFLDELEPGRGRKQDEIATECGINCELSWLNLKEELDNDEKRY